MKNARKFGVVMVLVAVFAGLSIPAVWAAEVEKININEMGSYRAMGIM